jgi:hypothetical protein
MIVGCYVLQLYCDGEVMRVLKVDEPPVRNPCPNVWNGGEPVQTGRAALKAATDAGWYLVRNINFALCPDCRRWRHENKQAHNRGEVRPHGN